MESWGSFLPLPDSCPSPEEDQNEMRRRGVVAAGFMFLPLLRHYHVFTNIKRDLAKTKRSVEKWEKNL
jgi:hypothetical protein